MKKSEKTKSLILASAIKILNKNSYLTFKEISADCNVNVASINYHFGTKDNLITSIEQKIVDEIKSVIVHTMTLSLTEYHGDMQKTASMLIDEIYSIAFKYQGVVKYVMTGKDVANFNSFAALFMDIFSMESDFTKSILEYFRTNAAHNDEVDVRIKYIILVSSFIFPLVFDLNIMNNIFSNDFSINNPLYKEKYIKTLLEILKF